MDQAAKNQDMYQAARIYRYANEILPAMYIDQLMDELVRAELANQNVDGHQYGEMNHQIGLIRDEIVRRTK